MHFDKPFLVAAVLLLLLACKSSADGTGSSKDPAGTPTNPVHVCTQEGQTCVFTEGKLGLCTTNMKGCDAGMCFVCMSLH